MSAVQIQSLAGDQDTPADDATAKKAAADKRGTFKKGTSLKSVLRRQDDAKLGLKIQSQFGVPADSHEPPATTSRVEPFKSARRRSVRLEDQELEEAGQLPTPPPPSGRPTTPWL